MVDVIFLERHIEFRQGIDIVFLERHTKRKQWNLRGTKRERLRDRAS
jgi:hypothetical protein